MSKLKVLLTTAALAFASTGSAQSTSDAELRAMEDKLTTLRKRFTDQHPEVITLLKRIEAHKSTSGPTSPAMPDAQSPSELQAARVRLAELRRLHTNEHPDVKKQIKLIQQLEQEEGK